MGRKRKLGDYKKYNKMENERKFILEMSRNRQLIGDIEYINLDGEDYKNITRYIRRFDDCLEKIVEKHSK